MAGKTTPAIPVEEIKNTKARKQLPTLCAEYRDLAEQKAAIDAAQKELMTDIKALAKSARLTAVQGDGWRLSRFKSGRSSISAEKLLENGVAVPVIEASTVRQEWEVVQITRSNGKEE